MKFTVRVDVAVPLEQTISLWRNPENLGEWQSGFLGMEHLSGTPGEVGARSRLHYDTGKREIELEETITVMNLPGEMTANYAHTHMENSMSNHFEALDSGRCRWTASLEYTRFSGIMPRLMVLLFPRLFKKQTQKWLDQFKVFAEREYQKNPEIDN